MPGRSPAPPSHGPCVESECHPPAPDRDVADDEFHGQEVPHAPPSAAPSRAQYAGALVALVLNLALTVAMAEVSQELQRSYRKPYLIAWLTHCGYLLCGPLAAAVWGYLRWAGVPYAPAAGPRGTFLTASALNALLVGSDTLWTLSVDDTIIAANNAIFQSVSVFTYVLSVIVLKVSLTHAGLRSSRTRPLYPPTAPPPPLGQRHGQQPRLRDGRPPE